MSAEFDSRARSLREKMSYEPKMTDSDLALWRSVSARDFAAVKAALDGGANPNLVHVVWEEYSDHYTPVLYHACRLRHYDIVAVLLERGSDPNAEYHERHKYEGMLWVPCLEVAKPDSNITQLLLSRGADRGQQVRRGALTLIPAQDTNKLEK